MAAPPNRIILDSAIHDGKPIIRGTRVAVATVVGSLAGGVTFDEVGREYDLSVEDIRAALMFATTLCSQVFFHRLPAV